MKKEWKMVKTHNRVHVEGPDWYDKYAGLLSEEDGLLIAAAPEGLRVAMNAYASILRLPRKERHDRQFTLASLRDYIAGATGRSAEDVQNEFEAKNPIADVRGEIEAYNAREKS